MEDTAVVIGAGIAGLTTAGVLSRRYSRVIVLDRDTLPDTGGPAGARRGVPQGAQPHILLVSGLIELTGHFPGLDDELIAAGGTRIDPGLGLCTYRYGRRWPAAATGLDLISVSRPRLEALIQARVVREPGVTIRDQVAVSALTAGSAEPGQVTGSAMGSAANSAEPGRVTGSAMGSAAGSAEPGRVIGVVLDTGEILHADLVVDCTGRGARSDRWLAALGLPAPDQVEIKANVAYASRLHPRRPGDMPGWQAAFTLPTPPHETMTGLALPIEDDRWLISIGGWHITDPPADAAAFEARARALPDPIVAEVMSRSEPLTDITVTRFPASRRRLFERLDRLPAGYVALGDAICSFNPIYGQGMTCAAKEATALGTALDRHHRRPTAEMARDYYAATAEIVNTPWQFAVGGDFAYPETTGPRPRGIAARNWYSRQIALASQVSPEVNKLFLSVQQLMTPPSVLTRPAFIARVLRLARQRA